MAGKLVGSFYFQRTNNTNLIGEFLNDQSNVVFPEIAHPIKPTQDFVGVYQSTWFDTINHLATLIINRTNNSNIYTLDWNEQNMPSYEGKAMLVKNKLIGYYKMV
jgi:hypothetical protein